MTYQMKTQLSKGEEAETFIDALFAVDWEISPVSREQQRQGIDRVFTSRKTGRQHSVEYKTDWTAGRTDNVFVETVSVDSEDKPGWAYASRAEWLFYYIPGKNLLCVTDFVALREQLPRWIAEYPPAPPIPNEGYNTLGILVPLEEFCKYCKRVINLEEIK
jgi:hypothetical protein